MKTLHKDETLEELARMKAAGSIRITPRELALRLEAMGYRIDPRMCHSYFNTANEFNYKARSISYTEVSTGQGYANVRADHKTLPQLQELRHWHHVFNRGRIWEL